MDENLKSTPMFVDINAQRFPLEAGQIYLFGKYLPRNSNGGDCTIVFNLDSEDVDEKHCCVEVSVNEDVYVFDLFSSGGTFLNGDRLKPLDKSCIKSGDVMKLGPKQTVRFYNDQQLELSHDSSGFGENNKNNSDIIGSSPESTSQREIRLKRMNSHNQDNFLVPAVPPPLKTTVSRSSNSFLVPETEAFSTSRRSSIGLNVSQNKSRKSDSFTIPETQYCGGRASLASNLSIAESVADEDKTKSLINFDVSTNDGDDDFCIPETQEVAFNSERPQRPLKDNPLMNGMKTLEEKSVDLNDSDDDIDGLDGESKLRICTQEYNDGFGEEEDMAMQSQVIPLIKHNTVLLNGSTFKPQTSSKTMQLDMSVKQTSPQDKADKEMSKINWSMNKSLNEDELNNLNCTTPDLFDCQALEAVVAKESATKDVSTSNKEVANLFGNEVPALDDDEDFLPTQIFPASSNSKPSDKDKLPKEKNIFCGKEDEPFLTLSDKENMHPGILEPITDLPPTQLFATAEAPSERSLASTSSRKSSQSQTEERQQKEVPIIAVVPNVSATIKDSCVLPAEPALVGDEEDDILTQAFLPPPPKSSFNALNTSVKKSAINYFNSTLLDDRAVDKNPASFFAEMETTPKKGQNSPDIRNIFKMPEKTFTSVRKTSSSASTASTDSDMDLLMCTPQFLRDQMPVSKGDDIRKHILAIKNKKLFGDDVENSDDTEDDRKSKENNCLVQLINVPKDSKDFDKLLPHLKHNNQLNKKTTLTDQQKAAKDARKEYKFNTSFGKEPQTNGKANTSSKSSTYSRDERHAARDKEKEIGDKGKSNKEEKQKSSRKNKHVDVAQTSKDKSMENNHSHTDIRQKEISSGSKQEKAQKSKSSKSRKDDSKEENETSLRSDDPEQKSSARHRHEKGQHNAEKEQQKVENEAPSKRPNRTIQDKDTNKKGGKVENEHEKHKEEQCRDDNKAPSKRPTRAIQEKDTNKKGGKVGRPSRDVADTEEIIIVKQTIQRKPKEAQEVTERPARRRTRQQSADKPPPAEETAKPVRRMTRLKSHTSKESVVTSDDLDSIPTQPLIRNTRARTRSRSEQKDNNESMEILSSKASHSSNSSQTLIRSHARHNNAHTTFDAGSTTEKKTSVASSNATTTERKRKSDVPVPAQNDERKRIKRTTSEDSTTSSTATSSSSISSRPLISITMVDPERFNVLNSKSKGLWAVAKDPKDSEVLVMDKSFRTFKFLLAMARGIPIVTSQWLDDINTTKSVKKTLPLDKYLFSDPAFEKKHKFTLGRSLQQARENKQNKKGVFHGYEFVMTTNIKPSPAEIQAIIEICGGIVHPKGPPPAKDNQKIYLVSSQDDRKDWHKYRRSNSNIIIIATEAIMSAVMRQNCTPLSSHVLA